MTSTGTAITLALAGFFLAACSKDKDSSLFDRKADNSFTHMVDSGVATMDNANTNVNQLNAQTAEQDKEMKETANQ